MNLQCTTHRLPRNSGDVSEDALRVEKTKTGIIAVLADGLGAARAGGVAAQRAVDVVADYYLTRPQSWSPRRALAEFAGQVNRMLFQESQAQYGAPEMLCTLSAVAIEGNRAYGLNVGDSPVLLFRAGKITRLSHHHVFEEAGLEHVLTRAVGLAENLEPHAFETPLESGDLLVVCSDGVTTPLDEAALIELLERRSSARTLVAAARHAAEDNDELLDDSSAVVIEILEAGWQEESQKRPIEVCSALRAGDRVNDFTLARALADTERVWLATRDDGESRVLKFPVPEARDSEFLRDAFVREVWQASRIDSPDFVRSSVPSDGPLRFYEMEYVDAPTLREFVADGPLKVEEATALGAFLVRAAQFLLTRGLAHGDIKPENILVLREGAELKFKLLDLGSVAEIFSVTSRAGTSSYVAPERFSGAALSERTEIFAIGVTLYEALTGHFPYGEVERFQTPKFDAMPPRLGKYNLSVPDWLNSIILRAVAPEVERRYQNFSELAYDLEHPANVAPFHRKDASLLERNPLIFFKLLSLTLALLSAFLLYRLLAR